MAKKEKKESFNLREALKTLPQDFILDGFKEYIRDKEIKDIKEFNELYKHYKEL